MELPPRPDRPSSTSPSPILPFSSPPKHQTCSNSSSQKVLANLHPHLPPPLTKNQSEEAACSATHMQLLPFQRQGSSEQGKGLPGPNGYTHRHTITHSSGVSLPASMTARVGAMKGKGTEMGEHTQTQTSNEHITRTVRAANALKGTFSPAAQIRSLHPVHAYCIIIYSRRQRRREERRRQPFIVVAVALRLII